MDMISVVLTQRASTSLPVSTKKDLTRMALMNPDLILKVMTATGITERDTTKKVMTEKVSMR